MVDGELEIGGAGAVCTAQPNHGPDEYQPECSAQWETDVGHAPEGRRPPVDCKPQTGRRRGSGDGGSGYNK